MGYYIRILGRNSGYPPLKGPPASSGARSARLSTKVLRTNGRRSFLNIKPESQSLCLEKNLVLPGQLGADELQEFVGEVSHYKPASAAAWLEELLAIRSK